jgi:hypothetical protein
MLKRSFCWVFLFLAFESWAFAQQSSNLIGTWVGKVQGFGIEMKLVLNANGTADYEGVPGKWRTQGSKLLLTQEGETVAYDFRLQGSQLTLSGGDLMAPLVLMRSGVAAAPKALEPAERDEESAPTMQVAQPTRQPAMPATPPAAKRRGLTETELTQLVEAGVASRRLRELVEERGIAFTVTPAVASRLKAKGATDDLLAALRGSGEVQRTAASPTPASPMPRGAAKTPGAGGLAAALGGPRHNQEKWGLSFAIPPNWKVGERAGALLLGSDTEAGLMIIRFMRRTNLQTLAEGYQEGMQEEGLQLMPAGQLKGFAAGGAQGLAGEMAGVAQDGARIRARTIGVQSPYGDAAVVMGLTTEEKYQQLKPRVESLASSFSFHPPPASSGPEFLAGQYYTISTSSYGSSERYINMCSDGRFSSQSGTYSTGGAGTAYGEGGQSAQWTAEGDERQGVIVVTYPNGNTERHEYQRSGSDLVVNGRTFARYGDGSCTKTSVY